MKGNKNQLFFKNRICYDVCFICTVCFSDRLNVPEEYKVVKSFVITEICFCFLYPNELNDYLQP